MRTELKLVNPEIAKVLLDQNVCNRPLRDRHVQNLATDMIAGRWRDNTAETIKIAKGGRLIDGQHRLNAVIKAKKSIKFMIAYDLNPEIMDVIDSGVKRTASDVLSMKDVKNSALTASIIRSFMSDYIGQSSLQCAVTNRMIEDEYFKDSTFWDNVSIKSSNWQRQFKGLTGSFFGYCYAYVLKNSNNTTKAVGFFDGLATGKECSEVIIDLRNKLINNHISDRKLSHQSKLQLIKSFWNGYVKNRKTKDDKTETWL